MRRIVLSFALMLASAGLWVPAADAVSFRGGDTVEIPEGTVIADDLYVAGDDIRIHGRVDGDLVVMGRTVTVTGQVRDDLIVAGGNVKVDGDVGESIRAAGGTVAVSGRVGRDLIMAGNQISQLANSVASGSALLTGREIAVRGVTAGSLRANGDTVLIDGRVASASVKADDITVTAGARIDGPLTYSSPREVDIRPGASVTGPVTREGEEATWTWQVPSWVGKIVLFMVGAVAGVLLALLAPGALAATGRELRQNTLLVLLAGAGICFGVPIVAVILTITILGIPLALSLMAFYVLGLYLAWVLAATAVGDLLLFRLPFRSLRMRMVLAALLGVFLLLLLQAIPWVGGLVAVLALVVGFGTATMALVNRLSRGV